MITPEEIIRRAERKYRHVLRAWLAGEDCFPMEFPAGRPSPKLAERRQQIERLRESSKEVTGQGYDLCWKTVKKRDIGKQTVPSRIIIHDLEDYLALIRKSAEFNRFVADVLKIRTRFPVLENWLRADPLEAIKHHGIWDDLLLVCDYFVKHPSPGVYIRELPIPVHTKFIENNASALRSLLDTLLPPDGIVQDAVTFNERFGLKSTPVLVRLRLLGKQLHVQSGLELDDLSLPVEQLAHLLREHVQPRHVVIVENLTNFLTLPSFPDCVGIFGSGYAIHLLGAVDWLAQCDVIYWGDMDAHGFEILSDLRGMFPNTRSVMMDEATWDAHRDYVVSGRSSRSERFSNLTEAEAHLARRVAEGNLRLEQEHIPHSYAVAQLGCLVPASPQ